MRRNHICVVATVPFAMRVFMGPHLAALACIYDITIVTSDNSNELLGLCGRNVRVVPILIERKISLGKDLRALFKLWRVFRKEHFDAVHSITPKAGMLAMLAARLAGVRIRLHTFTGQVWVTQAGLKALLLKTLDRVLAANATHLLADSHSQRRFLIANGITRASVIEVLAEGSLVGVDIERFAFSDSARKRIRSGNHIPEGDVVFMYLGRLNRDKGVIDLLHAFAEVAVRMSGHTCLSSVPMRKVLRRMCPSSQGVFPRGSIERGTLSSRKNTFLVPMCFAYQVIARGFQTFRYKPLQPACLLSGRVSTESPMRWWMV